MYEFSVGSSNAVITNLTKSTDGTINISAVFTLGPYGGVNLLVLTQTLMLIIARYRR